MTTNQPPSPDEDEDAEPTNAPPIVGGKPQRLTRLIGRVKLPSRIKVVVALAILLTAASVGSTIGLFYRQYRPDQATDEAAARSAIDAARDGTVAVLSYAPQTLERDIASAKSRLTGQFLSYYSQFTAQVVAPAVKQKSVTTTATVIRAAASELHTDSAVVLVYVNQSSASQDHPEPTVNASSVLVRLTRVHDAWLISSFDPV